MVRKTFKRMLGTLFRILMEGEKEMTKNSCKQPARVKCVILFKRRKESRKANDYRFLTFCFAVSQTKNVIYEIIYIMRQHSVK